MGNPSTSGADAAPRLHGVIGQDWYATHVAIRLKEFYFATSPWQRRLWNAGMVGSIQEVLDASRWRDQKVLSEGAVKWLCGEMRKIVGTDHGVPGGQVKRAINETLGTVVPFDSRHWRRLEQFAPMIKDGYLQRWSAAIEQASAPGPERVARAVAAHLLDRGYSMAYLHSGIMRHLKRGSQLEELFDEAIRLDAALAQPFKVVIPFEVMPNDSAARAQPNWLPAPEVKQWLSEQGGHRPDRPLPRYAGGFIYTLDAKDPYTVADRAAAISDRLLARASYAPGYAKIRASDVAWIQACDADVTKGVALYELQTQHRGVYVRSLVQEDKVHDVGIEATALDDALELAATLNHSSSRGPAISGGWTALEALLCAPADPQDSIDGRGVVVSARAAALVTCSWPRAELTALSYLHRPAGAEPVGVTGPKAAAFTSVDPSVAEWLSSALKSANSNRDRCQIVLDGYANGRCLTLEPAAAAAAQERVLAVIKRPHFELAEIRAHVQQAFRRLYRMRNIVMHGGAASAAGLEVTLRTVAPLVGAALDRIAHAQLVDGISPLALAARAELHLEMAGQPGAPSLVDLLE